MLSVRRPVRHGGAAGDKVKHQLVVGWEAEVRGCRVELVFRAHEEQLEQVLFCAVLFFSFFFFFFDNLDLFSS